MSFPCVKQLVLGQPRRVRDPTVIICLRAVPSLLVLPGTQLPPLPRPPASANSDPEHENAPLALPAPDPHVECGPRCSWLAHNLWVALSTSSRLPQISPILLSTCRSPAGAAESGGKELPPSPIAQWDQRAWRGGPGKDGGTRRGTDEPIPRLVHLRYSP